MQVIHAGIPLEQAATVTTAALKERLARGERVLWLLTGGSGVEIAVRVARRLRPTNLTKLAVSLTDERYGPIGHKDENWQQLLDAGLELPGAHCYRPLTGESRQAATAAFDAWLGEQFDKADYAVALFGIGSDGHTAGIKPHSSAVTTAGLAATFIGEDFERITMTPTAIRKLDEGIIQASGTDKTATLRRLLHDTLPLDDQPAQILKSIPHASLYTDINKEELI